MGDKTFECVKEDVLKAVERIREKDPVAAEYLETHLEFDEEEGTITYTGDNRLSLKRPNERE